MSNDSVVRSTAVCLGNLAADPKNKELLGHNALHDLLKRLPGGEGADGITDMTIGAILSTLLELLTGSPETGRLLKEMGGIPRIAEITRLTDVYSSQCVHVANRVLAVCWDIRELRRTIKQEDWSPAILQHHHPSPDIRADGLEYDESKNQFKTSYNEQRHRSPTRHPTEVRHRNMSPGPDILPASPHQSRRTVGPTGYDQSTQRSATMDRTFDPPFGYHQDKDDRGASLPARGVFPPPHPGYGVADSWV